MPPRRSARHIRSSPSPSPSPSDPNIDSNSNSNAKDISTAPTTAIQSEKTSKAGSVVVEVEIEITDDDSEERKPERKRARTDGGGSGNVRGRGGRRGNGRGRGRGQGSGVRRTHVDTARTKPSNSQSSSQTKTKVPFLAPLTPATTRPTRAAATRSSQQSSAVQGNKPSLPVDSDGDEIVPQTEEDEEEADNDDSEDEYQEDSEYEEEREEKVKSWGRGKARVNGPVESKRIGRGTKRKRGERDSDEEELSELSEEDVAYEDSEGEAESDEEMKEEDSDSDVPLKKAGKRSVKGKGKAKASTTTRGKAATAKGGRGKATTGKGKGKAKASTRGKGKGRRAVESSDQDSDWAEEAEEDSEAEEAGSGEADNGANTGLDDAQEELAASRGWRKGRRGTGRGANKVPLADRARYKRMNWWEKNQYHLERSHPELKTVWDDLTSNVPVPPAVAPSIDEEEDEEGPSYLERPKAAQPAGIKNVKLLPFQLEGLYWMLEQEKGIWHGGMLADEMGMGKTVQTISLMLSDRDPKPGGDEGEEEPEASTSKGKGKKKATQTKEKAKGKNNETNDNDGKKGKGEKITLVIAPTVALIQWKNEIEKFTEGYKVTVWHGAARANNVNELLKSDIVLTSYAVLESCFRKQESGFKRKGDKVYEDSLLHSIHWHRVVLDECHSIKDRACNTAKGAFALEANYRWCLSGTPLQNRVGELYSLIRFLGADPFAFYYCKNCPCKSLHWRFKNKRHCDDCGHTPMHHVCFWNNEILKPIQKHGHHNVGERAFGKLKILLDRMMLRRTKVERADDLGLPPRVVEVRRDYFTEEEEELYKSLFTDVKRSFSTYVSSGTVLNNYSNIFSLITTMRQMADHPDLVLKSRSRMAKQIQGISDDADPSGSGALPDDDIITCRLCLDEAEDPIMSSCRHIFCRECIRQYMETAVEQNPQCPTCHSTFTIDLAQEAIEEGHATQARQGMLSRIDPSKWRTSTKIEALVEELSKMRTEDHSLKSLVFSQYTSFLDLIERRLLLAGYKVARLQGNMTPAARNNTIQYFIDTPDCTVFLISLKAGGVALNLTAASRVYIMDPWWNPAVELQAMDRIHRLGQHRPILVKRMVIENSIESRIVELQRKKESMVGAALGDDKEALGRLTPEDLRFLFVL